MAAVDLDLTIYASDAELNKLLAFATYLGQVDAINLAKVMKLFTSYGEFTSFKD